MRLSVEKIILIKAKHRQVYLHVSALVLLTTGVSKLIMLTGTTDMLGQFDPITGMPFKFLLIIAGVAEVLVAAYIFFVGNQRISLVLIALMSSAFVFYRLAFRMTGWTKPCHCLGNLTDVFRISPSVVDLISILMLVILFAGSYSYLLQDFYQSKPNVFNT